MRYHNGALEVTPVDVGGEEVGERFGEGWELGGTEEVEEEEDGEDEAQG